MTEDQWLKCTYPLPMLRFLQRRRGPSERKLRLFAVACCRPLVPARRRTRPHVALETSERFADGLATREELLACHALLGTPYNWRRHPAYTTAWPTAAEAAEYAFRMAAQKTAARGGRFSYDDHTAELAAQAALVRDIFGTPYRRAYTRQDPAWLAWNEGSVGKVARGIYDDRAFERLPVLADALEEAGCDNLHLLAHLRGPGPHVRGCWALDLALGKA